MEVYVGTSGWTYSWNPKKSLSWYVENSGFNAVELNSSFYRFPTRKQVDLWRKYRIRWAVKVNRLITHVKRLKDVELWKKFEEIFHDLDPDFYLFQLPPNFKFSEENLRRVKEFEKEVGKKMAVEFRDVSWFTRDINLGEATIVSIDSPLGVYILNNSGTVYLRMHGRDNWYFYDYDEKELREDAQRIISLSPERVYVFFNNDLWMLDNGRKMMKILHELSI